MSATGSAATEESLPSATETTPEWRVGQLVSVAARTGPGMNQPGGVARILGIARHDAMDTNSSSNAPLLRISVKYVVSGSHEKNVDSQYVRPHEWETTLRNRTHNAGRCQRCGSLRIDCGFCDEIETSGIPDGSLLGPSFRSRRQRQSTRPAVPLTEGAPPTHGRALDSSDDSSGDESVNLKNMLAQNRRDYLRYLKIKTKSRTFYSANDLGEESQSDDSNRQERDRTLPKAVNKSKRKVLQSNETVAPASSDESHCEWTSRAHTAARPSTRPSRPMESSQRYRRHVHSKSVLEGTLDSSDDSCSDDNVPLVALHRSRQRTIARTASPVHSVSGSIVSNPGSPDGSGATNNAREVPPPRTIQHAREQCHDLGVDVPWPESGDEDFIQPEGRADQLPTDVNDATPSWDYSAILPFLDETLARLERDDIPRAKQQANELELQWKQIMVRSDHGNRRERRDELEQKSHALYEDLKSLLVRNGKDQCQNALRKLSSRSFYRIYKARCEGAQRASFVDHDDIREFKFDAIKESVDGVMAQVRNLAMSNDCDVSISGSSECGSDGWAFPDSQSPTRFNDSSDVAIDHVRIAERHYSIDFHPYANKKRKEATAYRGSTKRKRPKKPAGASGTARRKKSTVGGSEDSIVFVDPSNETSASLGDALGQPSRIQRKRKSTVLKKAPQIQSAQHDEFSNDDVSSYALGLETEGNSNRANLLEDSSDSAVHVGRSVCQNRLHTEREKHARRPSSNVRNVRGNLRPPRIKQNVRETVAITRASMMSLLESSTAAPLVLDSTEPSSQLDLLGLCRQVASSTGKPSCQRVFNNICNTMELSTRESDAALAFRTLIEYLHSMDSKTLQDLISSQSPALKPTIDALVAILRLVRIGVNKNLTPNDGLIFKLFAPGYSSTFVDFVVLQLTDSVMSLLHPDAWSLVVRDRNALLSKLGPLRDELSRHTPLVERICSCLLRELELQEWRCTRDGDNIFVSSVDPDAWISYLATANEPPKAKNVRFTATGQYLPRSEVEAIWCSIAFCSLARSSTNTPECVRWQLLSTLLLKGSLSDSGESSLLPPTQEQLDAAEADLASLSQLMALGSLGCIPRRDNVLVSILQRSVLLQSEGLLFDEAVRNDLRPSVCADSCFIPPIADHSVSASIDCLSKAFSTSNLDLKWMGQPLLLPSSGILCHCLTLLAEWKHRVGSPKRFRCFENAVKALVKNLSDTTQNRSADSATSDGDAFAAAFSSCTTGCDKATSRSRRSDLFRQESVAYFSIFASNVLSGESTPTSDTEYALLCEQVWRLLSDDDMRQGVSALGCESGSPFTGEDTRLRVAAKTLTLLTLPLMGVYPPRSLVNGTPGDEPQGNTDTSSKDTTLCFLFTCLVTCLDCACRSVQKDSDSITYILNYLRVIVLVARRRDRQHERDVLFSILCSSRVLPRCFQGVTTTAVGTLQGEAFVKVFTGTIKHLIFIAPVATSEPTTNSVDCSPGRNGGWDTSNDDDSIQTDLSAQSSSMADLMHSLQSLLVDALEKCRPSLRNAVIPHDVTTSTREMSVAGRKFVYKQSGNICALVSDLAAVSLQHPSQLATLCNVERRFHTHPDQGDTRYLKGIAQTLTQHICIHNTKGHVIELARRSKESVLFNLVESLLDVDLLAKVPSCNLCRIERSCGSTGEEKGFTELRSYQNGTLDLVNARIATLRKFCGDLGHLVLSIDVKECSTSNDWLGQLLIGFSDHYRERETRLGPSLELECFHRILLFRDLLEGLTERTGAWTTFERLSCLLLASCSSELARLLQKTGLQDRAHEGVSGDSYKKAKLFETLTCYVEVYASLVATIVRHSSSTPVSDRFAAVLSRVLQDFITQIFAEHNMPLVFALNVNVNLAASFLVNDSLASKRTESFVVTFDVKPYSEILRLALARRMRDFVVFTAVHFNTSTVSSSSALLSSLLAFQTSQTSRSVKSCFAIAYAALDCADEAIQSSPLVATFKNDIAAIEAPKPLTVDQAIALCSLRRFAIQQILIPKIQDDRQSVASRTHALHVSRDVLDLECEWVGRSEGPPICTVMLCSVAKGIRACALHALTCGAKTNDALLSASFACARALAAIPACCANAQAVGCLVDSVDSFDEFERVEDVPADMFHACYIRFFCKWLADVGRLILDGNTEQILALRLQFRSHQRGTGADKAVWPIVASWSDHTIVSRLSALESRVFPVSRLANGMAITNVYTTTRHKRVEPTAVGISSDSDVLEEWAPNAALISAISSFETKAVSTNK